MSDEVKEEAQKTLSVLNNIGRPWNIMECLTGYNTMAVLNADHTFKETPFDTMFEELNVMGSIFLDEEGLSAPFVIPANEETAEELVVRKKAINDLVEKMKEAMAQIFTWIEGGQDDDSLVGVEVIGKPAIVTQPS